MEALQHTLNASLWPSEAIPGLATCSATIYPVEDLIITSIAVATLLAPYIGALAAVLASLSYIPQVRKAWPRGSTKDLSLGMVVTLTSGLTLWTVYGALRGDWVIIAANIIGASLAAVVLGCKLRDRQ